MRELQIKHGGVWHELVIRESGVLVRNADDAADNGIRDGYAATLRLESGVEFPEPFGFGDTRAKAAADLILKLLLPD